MENQSFPPFEKGGQGGFIFKTKIKDQVASVLFSIICLSSAQLDSGLRRNDESKENEVSTSVFRFIVPSFLRFLLHDSGSSGFGEC